MCSLHQDALLVVRGRCDVVVTGRVGASCKPLIGAAAPRRLRVRLLTPDAVLMVTTMQRKATMSHWIEGNINPYETYAVSWRFVFQVFHCACEPGRQLCDVFSAGRSPTFVVKGRMQLVNYHMRNYFLSHHHPVNWQWPGRELQVFPTSSEAGYFV